MLKTNPQFDLYETHQSFCQNPYTRMILNSRGYVSMCCHQLEQLGKLEEDTDLIGIWRSNIAQEIRDVTDSGELHSYCKSWNTCPYICKSKEKNSFYKIKKSLYPTHIEICLPDKHCNIGGEKPSEKNPACIMCKRNFEVPEQEDLTDLFCRKVKPIMMYIRHLTVLGTAEPFWKDAVFEIFNKLDFFKYKKQIQFVTNTNGICLTEKTTKKFFEQVDFSDICWSLDAATPETHIKIRRLDALGLVVKNLKRWIEMREDYGGKEKHKVVIYNNINLLNVHEMTQMVEMAHDLKADKIIFVPTHDQSGVVKLNDILLNNKNLKIFKESAEKAEEKAKDLNFDIYFSASFSEVPPPVEVKDDLVQLKF
jgi:hypothetical protein